jgi:hypothetical protein
MFADRGIGLDTWVTIDETCGLHCEVIGDQAQFEFGHLGQMHHLIANEAALALLAQVASQALARWQSAAENDRVSFTVTATGVKEHASV